jgi:excisionase family DNA binding protein
MVAETETRTELTTAEAAALAGVSDRTIRNWIKDGLIKAHKIDEGRRIHKADLLAHLRERANNVAGVLGQEALTEKPAATVSESPVTVSVASETPEPHQNGQAAPTRLRLLPDVDTTHDTAQPTVDTAPTLTPELINMVLQPLREELEAERQEKRRLHEENIELAGRVGYYQAELKRYEDRVLLLEAPKEAAVVPQDEPERKPWYKRLFSLE